MFQGVLEEHDPSEKRQSSRRELGAHYTSERNILRVINPLFMDELRKEFEAARHSKPRLNGIYEKLASLQFFDPACGCGNFLVIAYREIRRLENEVIAHPFGKFKHNEMGLLDVSTLCRVKVSQFYGIEIDEAAAHIARVAMWITDHQLNEEAAKLFGTTRPTIPLVDSPHILKANSLRVDWNELLPAKLCSYLLGNPPFVGKKEQTAQQKSDIDLVFRKQIPTGILDYVGAWYVKALEYMNANASIEAAFVSTNSITQGEQVGVLWGYLLKLGAKIRFGHRTFKWSNDGKGVANVHCVIVGFSRHDSLNPVLYDYLDGVKNEPVRRPVKRVNPYLVDADNILIGKLSAPISPAPMMNYGSMPIDDGHLILSPSEREEALRENPSIEKVIFQYMGGDEFINGTLRYCLWLRNVDPKVIHSSDFILDRVKKCKQFRLQSDRKNTQQLAEVPYLFGEIRQPTGSYLLLPKVSSENRGKHSAKPVLPALI